MNKKRTIQEHADTSLSQSKGLVVGYKSDEATTLGVVTKGQAQGLATIQIVGLGVCLKQNGC